MAEADRAYERALTFLERRDRTEREVLDKLRGSGFAEEAIASALERLREAGLIDDAGYARRYLEALIAKGRGRLRIAAEMRRKGLSDDLIRNTIEDGYTAEEERAIAAEAARRCIAEMPDEQGTASRKATAKVSRRLVSQGFSYEVIGSAMRRVRAEQDEEF